jgi:hypothetical protein
MRQTLYTFNLLDNQYWLKSIIRFPEDPLTK